MSVIGAKSVAVAELAESQGYTVLHRSRQSGKFWANDQIRIGSPAIPGTEYGMNRMMSGIVFPPNLVWS